MLLNIMAVKDKIMNWINSWKSRNKKEKYNVEIRLGTFTLLEIKFCACCSPCDCSRFRFILFNIGFKL